jgi:hypothetical protein
MRTRIIRYRRADSIGAIEFVMGQRGLSRRDLVPMIRRLSEALQMPTDSLVRDYATQRAA